METTVSFRVLVVGIVNAENFRGICKRNTKKKRGREKKTRFDVIMRRDWHNRGVLLLDSIFIYTFVEQEKGGEDA